MVSHSNLEAILAPPFACVPQLYAELIYKLVAEGVELRPTLSHIAKEHLRLDLQKVLDANYDDVRTIHR